MYILLKIEKKLYFLFLFLFYFYTYDIYIVHYFKTEWARFNLQLHVLK